MTQTLIEQVVLRSGDFNGTVQLFFDNLATILSVLFILQDVLRGFQGSSDEYKDVVANYPEEMAPLDDHIDAIIYGRALPGLAVTMVFGNIYYSWMGARLGAAEDRAGDVTALPYGINTPGAFAFLFSIIGPAALTVAVTCNSNVSDSAEATAYRLCYEEAADAGWKAGVVSNFLAGLISIALGFMGPLVLKAAPLVALLTSLAGIGFVFLGLNQIAWSYSQPIVGLMPLYLSIGAYFGNVNFGRVPTSLVIACVGIVLGWSMGVSTPEGVREGAKNVQAWGVGTGFSALGDWSAVGDYIGITFPVALAAAASTLMNVISAENAGDKYGVPEAMISDGVGTLIGALFGTPFGTSVYIGHPAYKKMGAGIAYSLINCVVFFFFAVFGLFALADSIVPKQAVAPLLFFVGLMICQEALAAAPVRQYPAVLFGLMPAVLDWAVLGGLSLNGVGNESYWGFVSISKADVLLSLVSVAIAVYHIDRNYLPAAGWAVGAAVLSAFGLLHQDVVSTEGFTENSALYCLAPRNAAGTCDKGYTECANFALFAPADAMRCSPDSTQAWQFTVGYLMVAAQAVLAWLCQRRGWVDDVIQDGEEDEEKELKKVIQDTEKRVHDPQAPTAALSSDSVPV